MSPELRAKVRRLARERGYVPNARLAELMGEVRKSATSTFQASLCAFSLYPEKHPWQRPYCSYLKRLLQSGTSCAQKNGYKLEYLWYKEPGMKPERFRYILQARGIHGAFCLGSLDAEEQFPEALSPFAVTTFGASIPGSLHRVSSHFAADARLLFSQLLQRGYQRPGLAILVQGDRRTDYAYSSTYLGTLERQCLPPHTPVLRSEMWDAAGFHEWFSHYRPDVIVLHQNEQYIAEVERYLREQRLRVPGGVGLALLDKNPDPARYAGVIQDIDCMGETAIEMLIGRIVMRDFGPPKRAKIELVVGEWNEGCTLRPVRRLRGGSPVR